jgi:hypothetical protein
MDNFDLLDQKRENSSVRSILRPTCQSGSLRLYKDWIPISFLANLRKFIGISQDDKSQEFMEHEGNQEIKDHLDFDNC